MDEGIESVEEKEEVYRKRTCDHKKIKKLKHNYRRKKGKSAGRDKNEEVENAWEDQGDLCNIDTI